MLFDAANPDASVDKRMVSTVAPQSLFLLNHPFAQDRAKRLAQRVLIVPAKTNVDRLRWAFELLYSRTPGSRELELLQGLLASTANASPESAWEAVCHVLLCSNEFVYVE
jgi:hypothetical protein